MLRAALFDCSTEQGHSEYPLGLGYLKANSPTGWQVDIVEHPSELEGADVIGVSTLTDGMTQAVQIALEYEDTQTPVIVGGQGTLWSGVNDWPFDVVVRGEGEPVWFSILECASKDGPVGLKRPKACQEPTVVQVNTNGRNFDEYRPPVRGNLRGTTVPIITSRGCPYSCYFCSSSKYWGRPRYHSVDRILDEVFKIHHLYPEAKHLCILDDLFIANRRRFHDLFDRWIHKGLHERWTLDGFVRSPDMSNETARMLKAMGFTSVRFGAETASDSLLTKLGKQATQREHQRCIDACNDVGLPVSMSLMQYVPGETVEDRVETAKFIMKNRGKVTVAGNYRFVPFPGTRFYDGRNILEGDWKVRG